MMKKYGKAGLLIFLLVVPALVFMFIDFFGSNHYDLPYYYPKRDDTGKVMMTGKDTVYHSIPFLNMTNGVDTSMHRQTLLNRYTVISYVEHIRKDSTEVLFQQLDRLTELGKNIPALQVILAAGSYDIRIDQLRLHANIVVTGEPVQLRQVMNSDLNWADTLPMLRPIPYADKLSLLDSKGFIRGYYNGADPEDVDRLMAEIKILDYENRKK